MLLYYIYRVYIRLHILCILLHIYMYMYLITYPSSKTKDHLPHLLQHQIQTFLEGLQVLVFPQLGVPQNEWFISWKILLKWMIWGDPRFRTPPYIHKK